jgi:hypothetical protein
MHRISGRIIPPDNPAFFDIRYPAGYRILQAGYLAGYRILKIAGYPAGYPANLLIIYGTGTYYFLDFYQNIESLF